MQPSAKANEDAYSISNINIPEGYMMIYPGKDAEMRFIQTDEIGSLEWEAHEYTSGLFACISVSGSSDIADLFVSQGLNITNCDEKVTNQWVLELNKNKTVFRIVLAKTANMSKKLCAGQALNGDLVLQDCRGKRVILRQTKYGIIVPIPE